MIRYIILTLLCSIALPVLADDPMPKPLGIQAVDGIEGTGKKDSPFQFDSSKICMLFLPPEIADADLTDIEWDVEQAPSGAKILHNKRIIAFPIDETGLFTATAHGKIGYFKVWFEIKGPNGPPAPLNIKLKVSKALNGPTAKTDAVALIGTCQATIDTISNFKDTAELQQKFAEALNKNGWHPGVYADIHAIFNEQIPPGEAKLIDDAEKARLINFFSDVEAGASDALKKLESKKP